jgi:hypothetical protein
MAADSIAAVTLSEQTWPITHTLQELSDFLEGKPWRVVGSAAVRFWTSTAGNIGDLDIATTSIDDLPPTAGNDKFVLAHRHLPNAQGRHYAALISNATGIKIDVFTAYQKEPKAARVHLDNGPATVPMRDLETQVVALIHWLERRVYENFGFGPHSKFTDRIDALMAVANPNRVEQLWRMLHPDKPGSAYERYELAFTKAESQRSSGISVLRHKIGAALVRCSVCDYDDPDYPIASRLSILAEMLKHQILPSSQLQQ